MPDGFVHATLAAAPTCASPVQTEPPPPSPVEPLFRFDDLALVQRCRAHVDALQAYDQDGGDAEVDDDPLWIKVQETRRALRGLTATTLLGLMAKAEVAQYLASTPSGQINYSTSFTGDWLQQIVQDLVALDEGRFALRSDLPSAADASLFKLRDEHEALGQVIRRECERSPRGGRGHKKRMERSRQILVEALALPARSHEGRKFKSWVQYLAHVHGVSALRTEMSA